MVTKIIRPLLYGAAFFCSLIFNHAEATLKIALLDTGFCIEKAEIKSSKHIIESVQDMTSAQKFDCSKVTANDMETSGRFHGQKVLNEFLSYLKKDIEVTIYPLVIYDQTGTQTKEAWLKSIEFINEKKMDMVLTASGLINSPKLVNELPSIWFIPSGRLERLIDKTTVLFPQNLAPKPNLFIIGDYFDGKTNFYDQALLYQEQIDYYFPSGKKKFTGTSRAVAHAMAVALNYCFIPQDIIAAHSLRLCLMNKSRTLRDPILKKDFKTF